MQSIDTSELQKIITGRVEPHIYSFETNTLPNYLKIGDTYRPVDERLNEWRKYYADLKEVSRHKAIIDNEIFFRDYAVHQYLQSKGITKVPYDESKNIYSSEFFENAKEADVAEAIEDIKKNYKKSETYDYYRGVKEIIDFRYPRIEDYTPRKNQQAVIDAFIKAVKNNRKNLLMFAVMRFGKSVTSMWCAKTMNAKLTVVVTAKADVREEWKRTVESHKDFKGFRFIDRDDLKRGSELLGLLGKKFTVGGGEEELCTNIVLFLTLQDIAGSSEKIKQHHKIFQESKADLLIIDETHFGARAPVLGKILSGLELDENDKKVLRGEKEDSDTFGSLDKLKSINAGIKLHLSGTPYRILMGSEFQPEDIIGSVQFSDIYNAKLAWTKDNLEKNEWENPYYGFPQMIRFAFNPNESSRKKLAEIPGSRPSELFATASISKKGNFETFKYEPEVIDFLRVLDGSKLDTNLLGLLDNHSVKTGKLARHIVMVLPYRASCDALEHLVKKHRTRFKHLSEYTILNISGFNTKYKNVENIKNRIKQAEIEDKKTITLTVNKMLTGTTVPYWDTMIYLKSTQSPQDYDQAIFRLQSPWVEKYEDKNGNVIKYDMKPQTLLVDLDPSRLFALQEQKAQALGIITGDIGNEKIENFLQVELAISPIITLNAEHDKLVQVTASVVMDEVRKYSNNRTIIQDVAEIGVDFSLQNNLEISTFINSLPELDSKGGINIRPNIEEGEDLLTEDFLDKGQAKGGQELHPHEQEKSVDISSFEKRFRTFYTRILLFAFLSNSEEKSLAGLLKNIDANEDNRRIAKNLNLNGAELKLLSAHLNPLIRSSLDYKIQNADYRSVDKSISSVEHIEIAINKFKRLSESEVFTPQPIVEKIYNAFDVAFWKGIQDKKILDIASKSGSFAKGFIDVAKQHGVDIKDIRNSFYSIPTSPAAYEFTRKMYEALGLNTDNIAQKITSFSLLKLNDKQISFLFSQKKKFCDIQLNDLDRYDETKDNLGTNTMKFHAIVGNPPYQTEGRGNNRNAPIYHMFMERAYKLSSQVCLITPARFLFKAGQTPKSWNDQMLNDEHLKVIYFDQNSGKVFNGVNIKGGVVITYRDSAKKFGAIKTFTHFLELNNIIRKVLNSNFTSINSIQYLRSSYKFSSKLYSDNPELSERVKKSEEKTIGSNVFDKFPEIFKTKKTNRNQVGIMGRQDNKRVLKWVDQRYVIPHENLNKYKVLVPKSNGTGAIGEILSTPLIGEPLIGHTQTFISFGAFNDLKLANSALKYIKTKFSRALLGTMKITQDNATKEVWRNVPLQDFTNKSDTDWSKSIREIDKQLYKKYGLSKEEIDFIESHVKAMV